MKQRRTIPARPIVEQALASLRDAFDTRAEVSVAEIALSRASMTLAMLIMALAAGYGLGAPIRSGHDASIASMGIIAENMLRWRIGAPVWLPVEVPPDPSQYYCHHPFGIFWTTTLFVAVLGKSDAACRLPAFIASVASVPLVYALGRELYRPIAGAAAALAFVCLPISMSFASFNALEVPLMAWSLVTLLGWLRWRRRRRRADLLLLALGAAMAMNTDWPAFVLVAGLIAIELGATPFAAWRSPSRLAASVALVALALVIGGGYVAAFHHWGKLDDLTTSAAARAGTPKPTLSAVLDARAYWIELMFTPLGVAIGKAGAVVIAVGALVRRRAELLLPIAVLGMCLAQYLLFRQGADVHVFWPHTFALFFALAVAELVATAVDAVARLAPRRSARFVLLLVLGPLLVALLPIGADAMRALQWARLTGGRFNEKGAFIAADDDKVFVVRHVVSELPPDARVCMHASMAWNWSTAWSLGGRVVDSVGIVRGEPLACDVAFFDFRYVDPLDAVDMLSNYDVELLGPYAVLRAGEGFEAFSLVEREPTLGERFTVAPASPMLSVESDPYVTWEVAFHDGFDAPPPDDEPVGLEQLRVAHNIALRQGDGERAAALRARVLAAFEPRDIALGDVARVRGVRIEGEISPRAFILLEASRGAPAGVVPRVSARVIERAPLSITPRDSIQRAVSGPPLLTPRSWRRDFLYTLVVRLLPRPGRERFDIVLAGGSAARAPASNAPVELFRYP